MTDKGTSDKIKGKVKETVGDLTGDKSTKAEGVLVQAVGKAKEVANDVKETTEEVVENVKDKTEDVLEDVKEKADHVVKDIKDKFKK